MRLFIAVPLPTELTRAAAAILPQLPALRAVRPEQMHITLAFLGAVPDARLPDAIAATEIAAARQQGFAASVGRVGRFPENGPPRIVWLGLADGVLELAALAASVRAALGAKHLPFDAKPFRPHLTLARVRETATPDEVRAIVDAVASVRVAPLRFVVSDVLLIESRLGPQGPRYTPRADEPLGVGPA